MPRRLTLAVAPLLLALALAGCTESTRLPPPEPPAAGEPLFASDEEALAAATAAYEEYLEVSNAVFREPPRDLSLLETVATEQFIREERALADLLDSNGWVIQGRSELLGVQLQQWFQDSAESSTLTIYACLDVSSTRIVDQDGADVTPAERASKVTLEVELTGDSPEDLLINRSELWQDSIVCG